MHFTKSKIPSELLDNFKTGNGVFFIGAGLSVGSGFPTWNGLIKNLIDLADKHGRATKERIKEYKKLVKDNTKLLFLAEELKVDLGSYFSEYFEAEFSKPGRKPTINHEFIAKTNSSLIITINYDDLIERAFNKVRGEYPNTLSYTQSREAANNFWRGKFFILKAHGDVKLDVQSIILSQRDYRKTLYRENGYRSLLQSIFTTKSIVFLGVSLTDPEFNQLLDYLHDSYHGGGPSHYLLVDDANYSAALTRRYKDDFKIETITFPNPKKDYAELTQFLKIISKYAPY